MPKVGIRFSVTFWGSLLGFACGGDGATATSGTPRSTVAAWYSFEAPVVTASQGASPGEGAFNSGGATTSFGGSSTGATSLGGSSTDGGTVNGSGANSGVGGASGGAKPGNNAGGGTGGIGGKSGSGGTSGTLCGGKSCSQGTHCADFGLAAGQECAKTCNANNECKSGCCTTRASSNTKVCAPTASFCNTCPSGQYPLTPPNAALGLPAVACAGEPASCADKSLPVCSCPSLHGYWCHDNCIVRYDCSLFENACYQGQAGGGG